MMTADQAKELLAVINHRIPAGERWYEEICDVERYAEHLPTLTEDQAALAILVEKGVQLP